MFVLPPRQLVKGLLDGEKPYEAPAYMDALRGLCSGRELTCAHCGYHVEVDDFPSFLASLAGGAPAGSDGHGQLVMPPASEGYGLFRASPKAPSFSFDESNLELLCMPCFNAAQTFLPSVLVKGNYGLLPLIAQQEVIQIWRYLNLASRTDRVGAGRMQSAIDTMRSTAITDLHKALGLNTGTSTVTNLDLAYWWTTVPAPVAKQAATFLPDLVFIPAYEWDAYPMHLDYALFKNMLGTDEIAEMLKAMPQAAAA